MLAANRRGLACALGLCCALPLACNDTFSVKDRVFSALDDGGPARPDAGPTTAGAGSIEDGGGTGGTTAAAPPCIPAEASDHLHPRINVMAGRNNQPTAAAGFYTRDLFSLFQSHCGGCHVDSNQGGFKVSTTNFTTVVTDKAIKRIRSDANFMPPNSAGGKPFKERGEGDPVRELSDLLEAWIAAGRPADVFYPAGSDSGQSEVSYVLSERIGMAMTNLANCVPDKSMVANEETKTKSEELDELFRKAKALPDRLEQTDLFSLDAEELARYGVIAFAPAYTLWADNAKKIRFVRTPRGEPIVFDKETQHFSIPPNTRFYKTFFKKVVDIKGNESYRKMETRLILARPDAVVDGVAKHTALFGTYAWNEEETEAVLVRDPLRDGTPFRDRLVTFVTDEQKADTIIEQGPRNLQDALEEAGVTRTYAIPGSERCIQCHMGAPDKTFILGFTPLQIHRHPKGEHGVIEDAARDELNQLQRLIDYGVISGMSSPDEVLPLEQTQGDRKPRNNYELEAQGYMVGNCSHCHNPRGFPSIAEPSLAPLLNFLPGPEGGIFQFPLDRVSPRIRRGELQDIEIPYITPSLFDFTPTYQLPAAVKQSDGTVTSHSVQRVDGIIKFVDLQADGVGPEEDPDKANLFPLMAPWRSLIYRNVDAPFSYEDDSAIFPHMPLNTPGYDCRARQLLGTWMVSIPAKPIYTPTKPEFAPQDEWETQTRAREPQLYAEVAADTDEYRKALALAAKRVLAFQRSPRYSDCPDPRLDIVDPVVTSQRAVVPQPLHAEYDAGDGAKGFYWIAAPERPHWAVTDLTNTPGDWYPRRNDWQNVIVDPDYPALAPHVQMLMRTLTSIQPSDEFREFALEDVPFGFWEEKGQCDFSSQKKANELEGGDQPRWLKTITSKATDPVEKPLYYISPGAQTFRSICLNCHGPLADSRGRLANTIADMTGGQTRVANLRDGIFGPVDKPGSNRTRVFGELEGEDRADAWGARYLLWMTLGGTQRVIPPAVLTVIGNTSILGEKRQKPLERITDANMLSLAKFLCREVLPGDNKAFDPATVTFAVGSPASALIGANGDAEMWQAICTRSNLLPVRAITVADVNAFGGAELAAARTVKAGTASDTARPLYRRSAYPAGAFIGNQDGRVVAADQGVGAANESPWCIIKPALADRLAAVEAAYEDPPYCPESLLSDEANRLTDEEIDQWVLRGAMNAGLSVFYYLDALSKGDVKAAIGYNQCEQLGPK